MMSGTVDLLVFISKLINEVEGNQKKEEEFKTASSTLNYVKSG